MKERFWEIDLFRGIALALMLLFNWSYSLYYLGIYKIAEGDLYWWLFPRLIASMFIIIAGVVLSISYSKEKSYIKYLRRGAFVFSFGLLITAVTWVLVPQDFIIFGILHFIGFSIMFSPLLLRLNNDILFGLSVAFIIAGALLQNFVFDFPYLVWMGLMPQGFSTLDFFPVFPWLGIMILGIITGNLFYENGKRSFTIGKEPLWSRPLTFIGGRTLLIYVIHQPILIVTLYALGLL